MNPVNRFRFRNTMLIANVISHIIGATVVFFLFSPTGTLHSNTRSNLFATIDLIFPHGGMSAVSKTIRIRTRLIAFLAAINLIPMFTLARGSWGIAQTFADTGQVLSAMQTMIFSHSAIFSGVGIWLTFLVSSNLTHPLVNHATQAMIAAMNMNDGLAAVNKVFADWGHSPLQHGIGIHSGNVVAANIGSPSRLSYAVVGDTVNVASRLQDANKQYGTSIIVSAETHRHLS